MSGCTLLTSLGDLQQGSDAAVIPDAPQMMDGGMDAPMDAPVMDAPIMDAPPISPFCTMQDAQFCDDFDDSDAQTFSKWSSISQLRGGSVTRIDSDASTPFGIRSQLPPYDGGGPSGYLARLFVSAPTTYIHFALSMRVDKVPTLSGFNINAVRFGPNSDIHMSIDKSGSSLEETVPTDAGPFYPNHAFTMNFQPGKWTRVTIDVTVGNPMQVQVRMDGTLVLSTPLDSRHTLTNFAVNAGITYENPVCDGVIATIDNVMVDFK